MNTTLPKYNVPKVQDVMTKQVIAVHPEHTVQEALVIFNEHRISSAPVVNKNIEIIGYLSEIDLIQCIGNWLFYDEIKTQMVDSIMNLKLVTIKPNLDLFEVEDFFVENKLRHAPVVDDNNHLVGLISRRNIMRALEKLMNEVIHQKEGLKGPVELNLNALLNLPHR